MLQQTGVKTGTRNIHLIAGIQRLHKALHQNQGLQFAVQEQQHQLPPIQAVFVDQSSASETQDTAYSPEIVEPLPQRPQICDRAPELARPPFIAIHSPKSKINDAVPGRTRPWAFFRMVLGMDKQ